MEDLQVTKLEKVKQSYQQVVEAVRATTSLSDGALMMSEYLSYFQTH